MSADSAEGHGALRRAKLHLNARLHVICIGSDFHIKKHRCAPALALFEVMKSETVALKSTQDSRNHIFKELSALHI